MVILNLNIQGYRVDCLERSIDWLTKLGTFCKSSYISVWPKPKTRRLITVIRSPHVNKKSREQFQEITRSRNIKIIFTPKIAQVFLSIIEKTHFVGIEISIEIKTFNTLYLYIY
jgi:small subunit ribosomal protein S10